MWQILCYSLAVTTLGKRLLQARTLQGYPQLLLAAGTRNTHPLVSMVEPVRPNLSLANLTAAANALGVPLDFLCGPTTDATPARQLARELADATTRVRDLDQQPHVAATADDRDYIGVSGLAGPAGGGAVVEHERVTGCVKSRRDWLARHDLAARESRFTQMLGESMEPTLVDGCSLLGQPGQPAPARRLRSRRANRRRPRREARWQRPRRRLAAPQAQSDQAGLADRGLARRCTADRQGQVSRPDVSVKSDWMTPIVGDTPNATELPFRVTDAMTTRPRPYPPLVRTDPSRPVAARHFTPRQPPQRHRPPAQFLPACSIAARRRLPSYC